MTQPDPPAAPTATEQVTRPEPGLARGKWEAPGWVFWVTLALLFVLVGTYVAARTGALGRILKRPPPPEAAPVSKRGRRP